MALSDRPLSERDPLAATTVRWWCSGFRGCRLRLTRALTVGGVVLLYVVSGFLSVSAQLEMESGAVAELHVVFDEGRLSVNARDVALQDILEEIAIQCGLVLSTRGSLSERMTRSFAELELTAAMDTLLNGMSYALQYAPDTPSMPSRLWVMSRSDLVEESDLNDTDTVSGGLRQGPFEAAASQRLEAVAAFAERETGAYVFEIEPALNDESKAVRYEAIFALGETGGDSGTAILHQLLSDPDGDVRAAAIDALTAAGGELSAATLATALHDPDPALRENAVYGLGEIGGRHAVELINQATSDPDVLVRQAVEDVLSELADQH